MASDLQRFGHKVRTLRLARQMTLKELATELGYTTHAYLSEIESGKKLPTVTFVLRVARLFEVSTDDLLKDERDVEPPARLEATRQAR